MRRRNLPRQRSRFLSPLSSIPLHIIFCFAAQFPYELDYARHVHKYVQISWNLRSMFYKFMHSLAVHYRHEARGKVPAASNSVACGFPFAQDVVPSFLTFPSLTFHPFLCQKSKLLSLFLLSPFLFRSSRNRPCRLPR